MRFSKLVTLTTLLLGCIPALADADQIYDGKFSYVSVCQNFTEVIKNKGYVQFVIQATSTVNGAEKGTATFLGMPGTVRYFTPRDRARTRAAR